MKFEYKKINSIIYLFLFLLITMLVYNYKIIEGLTDFERYSEKIIPYPKNAIINYNDINSPLYSHTVNLPINDPVSCKNFCGPNAKCLLTGEQCTSDLDCAGCNPGLNPRSKCITKEVMPYDASGKLGQNQGLQYSPLTTGYNNHNSDFAEVYNGSKNSELTVPYNGLDTWTNSFNAGLKLYNKKRQIADEYAEGVTNAIPVASDTKMPYYEMKYPMRRSLTGQFYETTPPASNSNV